MDLSHLESASPEVPSGERRRKRSLVRRATLGVFRGMGSAVRGISETVPGRYLRRRLLSSIHYAKKGVQIVDPNFDGLSIMFLSDIHAGHVLNSDDLARIFAHLDEQRPDVICFGGDLVDSRPQDLELLRRPLSLLRPRLGMFAVAGNHEYHAFKDIDRYYGFLRECGVTPLHNRGVRLELGSSSVWLGGVDDATEGRPSVSAALDGRSAGEPTVLLSHHPDIFPLAAKRGVDLQLSGHTHGGQISLLGWKPLKHSKRGYLAGSYWRGSSALYVTRGVGVTALPFRFGVNAEVPLFDLRPLNQETRDRWVQSDFDLLSPDASELLDSPGTAVFLGVESLPSALPKETPAPEACASPAGLGKPEKHENSAP